MILSASNRANMLTKSVFKFLLLAVSRVHKVAMLHISATTVISLPSAVVHE